MKGAKPVLATTFNRLHPQKVEGGSTPEEFRIEYVADRTQTFATAFLGITLECARCHDHKFDPVSQADYYALAGIMQSTRTMESLKRIAKWNENLMKSTQNMFYSR